MPDTFAPPKEPKTVSEELEPKVLTAPFGDQYEQRTGDGIAATDGEVWRLSWGTLSQAEADEIWDFLRPLEGVTPFYWTPPDEDEAKLYVASDLRRSYLVGSLFELSCTFKRVFDI
jgi:phage-related protein